MSSIELISSTKSTSRRITAEEYFATYPETNLPMELLEGEVIAMPVPNDDHQHISSALHLALGMEIIPNKLGELRHALLMCCLMLRTWYNPIYSLSLRIIPSAFGKKISAG